MADAQVLRSQAGRVVMLTLNRPDKLNALTAGVLRELRVHLEAIARDEGVGCVVLAGAGRSFCAGHDLEALAGGNALDSRYEEAETIDLLESLPQPTIGRLQGHCLTGGLELALGCDLLVAASNVKIGDTHAKWGLVPVWGLSVRLPERVGMATAKRLMFTCEILDGAAAAAIGLVDESVAEAELDARIGRLAAQMAANASQSHRVNKALLHAGRNMSREEALRYERDMPFGQPSDSVERLAAAKAR
jgi:enoyl-CoA hydratase